MHLLSSRLSIPYHLLITIAIKYYNNLLLLSNNIYSVLRKWGEALSDFRNYIKKVREDKGLKMRELERLSGISQSYISQIENGKRSIPTPDVIKKLANGLNENPIDLMVLAGYFSKEEAEQRKKILNQLKKEQEEDRKESYNYFNVEYPKHIIYDDDDGTSNIRETTIEDVYDIFSLLHIDNCDIYYKYKKITNEEKKKILTMLKTILE